MRGINLLPASLSADYLFIVKRQLILIYSILKMDKSKFTRTRVNCFILNDKQRRSDF